MAGRRSREDLFRDKVKRWNEGRFKYIDVIVSSGEIRKLFFSRCKELNVDPYRVAMKAGIPITTFKDKYVKEPEPSCTNELSQQKFIRALELVGIDIKISVIPKPFSETYVKLIENGIIKKKDEQ